MLLTARVAEAAGRFAISIYQSGAYQLKASAVEKVKAAIQEFVNYVQANEPGTEMYLAWQQKEDPTRFIHLFRFKDADAQARLASPRRSRSSKRSTHRSWWAEMWSSQIMKWSLESYRERWPCRGERRCTG